MLVGEIKADEKLVGPLYSFPQASIAMCHSLDILEEQKCAASQFWKMEVETECWQSIPLLEGIGQISVPGLSPSSGSFLAWGGITPNLTWHAPFVHVYVQISPFIRLSVILAQQPTYSGLTLSN
jgi:hypothetical protein